MKANEFFKAMGIKAVRQFLENDNIRTKEMHDGLKRLVESHELVEAYGGLDKTKKRLSTEQSEPYYNYSQQLVDSLKQAIADVESCK